MKDPQPEQSQNDLDIQITDIDETGVPVPATESSRPSLPPRSPSYRKWQLPLTAAFIILTILIILATTPPARNLVTNVFIGPIPSPTPTLAPGIDLFYFQGSPSWGQLSIDGHSIPHLPVIQKEPPLRLSRGPHLLTWQAAPFLPQRCTLSVPPTYGDNCPLPDTINIGRNLFAWVIKFSLALDSLPDQQRFSLISVAQVAVNAQPLTDTIRPGELYALPPQNPSCKSGPQAPICYAIARQPLTATLNLQLDTNAAVDEPCTDALSEAGCFIQNQNCHLFCTVPSAGQEWEVLVPVQVTWTFATLNGHILEAEVPDSSPSSFETGPQGFESFIPLRISWDGSSWHATTNVDMHGSAYSNPACTATLLEIQSLEPPPDATGEAVYPQWQYASNANLAAGCLAEGTIQPPAGITPTPTNTPPFVIYCLHRFGVLLAVNSTAQRAWGLPLANPYEQTLAHQLATDIGSS